MCAEMYIQRAAATAAMAVLLLLLVTGAMCGGAAAARRADRDVLTGGLGCAPAGPSTQCVNGTCVNGTCECNLGWTGPRCDTAVCVFPCHGNAHCKYPPFTCECNDNWFGARCDAKPGRLSAVYASVAVALLLSGVLFVPVWWDVARTLLRTSSPAVVDDEPIGDVVDKVLQDTGTDADDASTFQDIASPQQRAHAASVASAPSEATPLLQAGSALSL